MFGLPSDLRRRLRPTYLSLAAYSATELEAAGALALGLVLAPAAPRSLQADPPQHLLLCLALR